MTRASLVVFAEGENHRITLDGGVVRCTVWRVPSMSTDEGASAAEALVSKAKTLAATSSALLFDITDTPAVAGPRTATAIGDLFATYAKLKRRVAVIVGTDALKQLQMRRILNENAPRTGALFTEADAADAWLAQDPHARQ